VERLLRAAERVIADSGYEAATMCEVARRAHSAVGSLYQFFPNKESLAEVLRESFTEEYEEFWKADSSRSQKQTLERLVERLLSFPLGMARRHPAFLPLLDLPPSRGSRQRHERMRQRMATVVRAGRPELSPATALRLADVLRQVIKGCLVLYARASPEEREGIVKEFRFLIAAYLRERLGE
jgi:AcrR family transcriptional regulator